MTAIPEQRHRPGSELTWPRIGPCWRASELSPAGSTGLASAGIGLGFQALFLRMEPAWVPRLIATAFLLLGIYIFVAAEWRARDVLDRLEEHEVKAFRNARLRLITIFASAAIVALILALWLLPLRTG